MADRSELCKLELRGREEALAGVVERLTGMRSGQGLALPVQYAWLCALDERRALVLCDPTNDRTAIERVRAEAAATPGVTCTDVSDDHAGVLVIGPNAPALLGMPELGLQSPVPQVGELAETVLAGSPTILLREGEDQFLIVTDRGHAISVWHALHDAGGELGIGSVGRAALDRYAVGWRTRARQHERVSPAAGLPRSPT